MVKLNSPLFLLNFLVLKLNSPPFSPLNFHMSMKILALSMKLFVKKRLEMFFSKWGLSVLNLRSRRLMFMFRNYNIDKYAQIWSLLLWVQFHYHLAHFLWIFCWFGVVCRTFEARLWWHLCCIIVQRSVFSISLSQ